MSLTPSIGNQRELGTTDGTCGLRLAAQAAPGEVSKDMVEGFERPLGPCLLGPPGGGFNTSGLAFGELWGPFLALGAFQEVSRAFLESSWASPGPQGRFQGRSGGCFQVLEWSLDGLCSSLGGPWVAPSTLLDSSWSV